MANSLIDFGIVRPELATSFATGFRQAEENKRIRAQQEQANQLAALQLRAALRGEEEALAEREAYKGAANLSDVQQRLMQAGLGKQSLALQKQQQEQQAARIKQAKDSLDLMQSTATQIMSNPDLGFAKQAVARFGQMTGQDVSSDLAQIDSLGNNPDAIKSWAAGHALKAADLLPKFENLNLGGVSQRQGYNPITGAPIGAAQVTPMVAQPAAVEAQKVRIAQAGRPSINISTEKKYGEAFAGKLAESDIGIREAALKAPELANTANRILDLTSQGKIFTGSAANVKLEIAKALNMAGLTDSEKAANTEALISDMGASTLAAIKTSGLGSGQGFTNKDLEFLQNVAGGRITLEKESIKRIADLQHKVAEAAAQKWNARIKQIPASTLEGTGLTAESVQVPKKFSAKPQLSAQDQQAADWANANPKDPRAAQIKQRLGIQ